MGVRGFARNNPVCWFSPKLSLSTRISSLPPGYATGSSRSNSGTSYTRLNCVSYSHSSSYRLVCCGFIYLERRRWLVRNSNILRLLLERPVPPSSYYALRHPVYKEGAPCPSTFQRTFSPCIQPNVKQEWIHTSYTQLTTTKISELLRTTTTTTIQLQQIICTKPKDARAFPKRKSARNGSGRIQERVFKKFQRKLYCRL